MFVDELETLAKLKFNLSQLKPFQHAIISDFIHGHDILVISPTGSGKSLCYQLPALLLPGTFIIISPLIALMQDQVKKLKAKSIEAECLHAELTKEEQKNILTQVQNAQIKLLYVSPERLLQNFFLSFLKQQKISGFAIDEVHCMLQWGHDFRPEYQDLSKLKSIFPDIPIMALTATANPRQQNKMLTHLGLQAKKHIYSIHRPNIEYEIIFSTHSKSKLETICMKHAGQTGIIYAASRQRVDFIENHLRQQGFKSLKYHAGMSSEEKQLQLNVFQENSGYIMVATVAFGMGVDKADIRFIVHLDTPGRLDQFVQESGRCGRDGELAHSYILFHPGNFLQLNFWQLQKTHQLLFHELVDDLQNMSKFLISDICFYQFLQNYYEQIDTEPCGKCIRCQAPKQRFQLTEDHLKILSCIYRLHHQASSKLIIEVLQGLRNSRTQDFEHLSTFGIGKNLQTKQWLQILISLFAQDMIGVKKQAQLYWQLSEKAKMALKLLKHAHIQSHQPDLLS